jgi:hypothetical protein
MKTCGILLAIMLTVSAGAVRALAQHGHGMGHMVTHGDLDHDSVAGMRGRGHTPVTPATRLANHPALAARLQPLLPAGTNLQTAARGFKNLGQFIAAVHVSHNLGIPFDQLKAQMTGSKPDSLGQAIENLRPSLSSQTVKSDVKTAEHQAKQDLEATEQPDKDNRAPAAKESH